jgi:EmrB/QacA subfamily drug resistance transporter
MANFVQRIRNATSARSPLITSPAESRGRWILAATILGSSMAFIDGTVVNVALPAIQTVLKADVIDIQWVIEAYALLLTALLLVGGSLGDRYGRRRIFLVGIAGFAVASAWCGLARGIRELIIARAFQGLGAALLVPASLAIISAYFGNERRGRAIGTWSGFTAITTALGPVAGGWLIEHVSWRAAFFINIPIAAAVAVISRRHVPESRDPEDTEPLDWTGAALVTFGLATLVYALLESPRLGFTSPTVTIALIAAFCCLAVFFAIESRAANPMLPMSLFHSRNFSGANLITLFLYAALGGTLFFLPLNLIQVQHYTATGAGAALLPFIVLMAVLSRWAGGLVSRFGARIPLIIGPAVAAAGFALFMLPSTDAVYWTNIFPAVFVLGLGMTLSVAPLTTTVMNSVPANHAGIASGVNNAVSRAASLLAIAIFGIVMLQAFSETLVRRLQSLPIAPEQRSQLLQQGTRLAAIEIPADLPAQAREQIRRAIDQSFVAGYRRVMLIGSVLALTGAIVSWLFIIDRKPRA